MTTTEAPNGMSSAGEALSAVQDHCTCPGGQRCGCGYAAMLSAVFFGEDAEVAGDSFPRCPIAPGA